MLYFCEMARKCSFFGFIVEADTDSEGNELKVYEENDRK